MLILFIFPTETAVFICACTKLFVRYSHSCAWFVTVPTVVTVPLVIVTGGSATTETRKSARTHRTAPRTLIDCTASSSASSHSLTDFKGVYAILCYIVSCASVNEVD